MAKAYAFTTTSRFKTYAGITASTYDSLISILIDQVTEYIENYIGRRIKLSTYTSKEYDGTGTYKLVLEDFPVVTFTTLQERSTTQNEASWNTIAAEDYFVELKTGIITAVGFRFLPGTKLYRATYTAGYDFDNSATFLADTEAGDLEWVAWQLINTAFNNRKQDPSVSSVRLGDASVSYRATTMEEGNIKALLDKYRQVII